MKTEYKARHGSFTLNQQEPDQFGNTWSGTIWQRDGKGKLVKHWLNGADKNGGNGPFVSGFIGKPKLKQGQAETAEDPDYTPPPQQPASKDREQGKFYDDDIQF